jgi:hypothetical protein
MVQRRDIAACIIFSLITCGIYSIYWFICLADDVNTVSNEQDTSGGMVFLLTLLTCGIYGFYWAYRCGEKLDKAKQMHGINAGNGGAFYLLILLFAGIISYAVIQHEINKLAYYR